MVGSSTLTSRSITTDARSFLIEKKNLLVVFVVNNQNVPKFNLSTEKFYYKTMKRYVVKCMAIFFGENV